jgi:hypothetical protein
VHPLINVGYMEVFDAFGDHRNLGVALNVFYSENVAGYFRTIRDFENTTNQPAYVWDYRTQDAYNNRKQFSVNLKNDFRLSAATRISFNMIYNDANEPYNRLYETRAFTNQTTPNNTTSGVVPGYTDRITTVRPIAASVIDVTETMFSFFNRTRQFDLGVEHKLNRWEIDYNATYSQTHNNLGSGKGGTLTNRISNVGWILDRTESDLYPKFIPNGGGDFTNASLYLLQFRGPELAVALERGSLLRRAAKIHWHERGDRDGPGRLRQGSREAGEDRPPRRCAHGKNGYRELGLGAQPHAEFDRRPDPRPGGIRAEGLREQFPRARRQLHEVLPERSPHPRSHRQPEGAAELVDQLWPAGDDEPAAQ